MDSDRARVSREWDYLNGMSAVKRKGPQGEASLPRAKAHTNQLRGVYHGKPNSDKDDYTHQSDFAENRRDQVIRKRAGEFGAVCQSRRQGRARLYRIGVIGSTNVAGVAGLYAIGRAHV